MGGGSGRLTRTQSAGHESECEGDRVPARTGRLPGINRDDVQ